MFKYYFILIISLLLINCSDNYQYLFEMSKQELELEIKSKIDNGNYKLNKDGYYVSDDLSIENHLLICSSLLNPKPNFRDLFKKIDDFTSFYSRWKELHGGSHYFRLMKLISEIGGEMPGGHKSGFIQGESSWKWVQGSGYDSIEIEYTALDYYDKEIGDVKNMFYSYGSCGYKDCTEYLNFQILGRWVSRTSGSGDLNIAFSSTKPEIEFYVFGDGNWQHWTTIKLNTSLENYLNKLVEINISDPSILDRR